MRAEPNDLPKAVVPSVLKAARLLDEITASREPVARIDLTKEFDRALNALKLLDEEGAVLEQRRAVREKGFARDDEETHEGMFCIGVYIHDPDGGPVLAALAVSMFKGRKSKQKDEQTVKPSKRLARILPNPLKLLR